MNDHHREGEVSSSDRRQFHRVLFDADVILAWGGETWRTRLIDISMKGVLIREPRHFDAGAIDPERPLSLTIPLGDGAQTIRMDLDVAHHGAAAHQRRLAGHTSG